MLHSIVSVLVVFSHLLVSVRSDSAVVFASDAMLRSWMLLAVLVITPHMLSPRTACWEQRSLNLGRVVLGICISVVANATLAALTCASVSYCFLVHSVSSFAWRLAVDDMLSLSGRAVMVFTVAAVQLAIHVFPMPLPVSVMRAVADSECASFEAAHLWALVCVVLARGATDTVAELLVLPVF